MDRLRKINGIFITGTDTGVGKTIVSAGLIKVLRDKGIKTGYFKPVASGAKKTRQGLLASDVAFVLKTAGLDDPPRIVNPVCLGPALAPLTSAELSGVSWRIETIDRAYQTLQKKYDFLVVEGVGGVMVPLRRRSTVIDLMDRLQLPALVVARPYLGTVNHTLMTLTLLEERQIPVLGYLFNGQTGKPGLAERTAPDLISKFSGASFWGSLILDRGVSEVEPNLGVIPKKLIQILPKNFLSHL